MIRIKTPVKTVAQKLKVTTQSVYAWKLGRYMPSVQKLKALATLEGVSMEKLIK